MNKLIFSFIFFLSGLILLPIKVSAMMHANSAFEDSIVTQSLSEEKYKQLGEQLMEQMMGERHEEMEEQMVDMMGEDFLHQMHVAMGKRSQNPGSFGMMPMMEMMGMGNFGNMMADKSLNTPMSSGWRYSQLSGLYSVLGVVTRVVLVAFLLAGVRFFWKKGN